MTQPLAILNYEECYWLDDLGLPNQRRWLNHRTLGDEHRRTFPSAATHTSITGHEEAHNAEKVIGHISFDVFHLSLKEGNIRPL